MEQESECLKKMKNGDLEARNELIERNMRLVAHVAKKYQSPEDEMEDLISIGTIGLIKAVETYKEDYGSRLATYAARCIDNEDVYKRQVEASLRLIGCNKERFQKKIQANQEAGEPVEYAVFKSQREEIAKIIWDIQAHMDRGGRYEDFAILFRTNTQPQMLMEKLLEYNIPRCV